MILGVPPAKKTKMTAMPQLVALFNGVGGGTVALIAWAEFIETDGFAHFTPEQSPTVALVVGSLFAAIIGSVSFWGSLVAFLKLQESIPKNIERALVRSAKLFQVSNVVLLLGAIAASVYIGLNAGHGSPRLGDRGGAGARRHHGPVRGVPDRRGGHAGGHHRCSTR